MRGGFTFIQDPKNPSSNISHPNPNPNSNPATSCANKRKRNLPGNPGK